MSKEKEDIDMAARVKRIADALKKMQDDLKKYHEAKETEKHENN